MRRAFVIVATALTMLALKRHYSTADVEDLKWILAPTSVLVAALSGATFEFERGEGYLSRERFFVIEKSCAGLNFMIAALGMIGVGLARDVDRRGTVWILAQSLALSYAAAVVVNTARILLAMRLASTDLALEWWTASRIHRLEGIAVYFAGLCVLNLTARALLRSRRMVSAGSS
jgi:exosortase K